MTSLTEGCLRCHGLMVLLRWPLLHAHHRKPTLWHCLNCGDVIDRTILANRRAFRPSPRDFARKRAEALFSAEARV